MSDEPLNDDSRPAPWGWILCLVGLDYFGTLAYQPAIAVAETGALAPLANLLVVAVTLGAALPVYWRVAGKSDAGEGAIGLLDRWLKGWWGKTIVLALLGFAATDFVIGKTLAASDAAQHVLHNESWRPAIQTILELEHWLRDRAPAGLAQRILAYWSPQLVVAVLVVTVGIVFWAVFRHGFTRRVVRLSVLATTAFLLMTGWVIVAGLAQLATTSGPLAAWWEQVRGAGWGSVAAVCLLAFPKLALGIGGFELTMIVMPLVQPPDDDAQAHRRRIRNTRKMLLAAALVMSLWLLGATLVTAALVPLAELEPGGAAQNRALAYLAHAQGPRAVFPWFGPAFGTAFDVATIVVLGLAGASVMIGLKRLAPTYLLRFGMELEWAHRTGATLHLFNLITLAIAVLFRASVDAQRGAYCTSILVLLTAAALAAAVSAAQEASRWRRLYGAICGFFALAALASVFISPDGLLIAAVFVVATLVVSILSRTIRGAQWHFEGFRFADNESRFLWESLQSLDFHILAPHRPGRRSLDDKEESLRRWHRLDASEPIVFLEVEQGDPSDYQLRPLLKVGRSGERVTVWLSECASIPHAIAAVALALSRDGPPLEIHFGWSDESPLKHNLNFVLFGRGNIPWMVRELLRQARPGQPPRIIMG